MGANFMINYEELTAMILFGIGFTTLLFNRNLLKKIIGLNLMDTGVYLFLTSMGYIRGRLAPILTDNLTAAQNYVIPSPPGLYSQASWYLSALQPSCFL